MSWTRAELKEKARNFLKEHYWKAFLVTIIVKLISGDFINFGRIFNRINIKSSLYLLLLYILIDIFIINVLRVGLMKFYIEGEKGNVDVLNVFSFFDSDGYLNIVKTMFLMNLYIVLWHLLFIIPGIVKSYEYIFIPYLLAENPNISVSEAFQETKRMTKKQKIDIFFLDLSFAGWYLLGNLVVIGAYFVIPYHRATRTQLYFAIKNKALN